LGRRDSSRFIERRRIRKPCFKESKDQKALFQGVERLEKKKRKLEREIEELKTNPKALEKKAREKLWLQKPDEIVIVDKKK
jgi:cell division protein FtsB